MKNIAVIIPCYRCASFIDDVLRRIPAAVSQIYVVDDACPQNTGRHVEDTSADPRIRVLYHAKNLGVGGAMVTGFRAALENGADIAVKIDGDGQIDPALIPDLIEPLRQQRADYSKGNRFFRVNFLKGMPPLRMLGNAALSFLNKLSTGYWSIMDPTNGFVAIHRQALIALELERLNQGFFFESDMLFQLNLARAVVVDVPMRSAYGAEISNLKIRTVLPAFLGRHLSRMWRRFFYTYVLRDFNLGTLEALGGAALLAFGAIFGGYHWYQSYNTRVLATSGTVMVAGMSVIVGFQLLLSWLSFDISNTPRIPLQALSAPKDT